jgi:hypothetical protein
MALAASRQGNFARTKASYKDHTPDGHHHNPA